MRQVEHIVFLERKFPERDPRPEVIKSIGATGVIAWLDHYDALSLNAFRDQGLTVDVAVAGFQKDHCPLAKTSIDRLMTVAHNALRFSPRRVIFDHFRFDGDWEEYRTGTMPGLHTECQDCLGKNRSRSITTLAQAVRESMNPSVELGYFDVPFHPDETPSLGQDARSLSASLTPYPMLYHQMIDKSVDYIHEYLRWLRREIPDTEPTPILQVKSMPDVLPDTHAASEIQTSYLAARFWGSKVAWFSWDGIEEKGKEDIFRRVFANI